MLFFVQILFSLIFCKSAYAASDPYLTEAVYSDPQWVEIYNPNNSPLTLDGWKIGNMSGPQVTISSLQIGATSYGIYAISTPIFKTSGGDYAELWNGTSSISRASSFPDNLSSYSWSKQSGGNWCIATPSQRNTNNSCYVSATPTPTTTPTPTITPTPTKSAVVTPTAAPTSSISPTLAPTPTREVAPTLEPTGSEPTAAVVNTASTDVGTTIITSSPPKSNKIGLIFILVGGLLLLSPLLITQIQKWRKR